MTSCNNNAHPHMTSIPLPSDCFVAAAFRISWCSAVVASLASHEVVGLVVPRLLLPPGLRCHAMAVNSLCHNCMWQRWPCSTFCFCKLTNSGGVGGKRTFEEVKCRCKPSEAVAGAGTAE